MTYDLPAAVNEVLDGGGLTDYAEIAAKVAENVPSRELRTVLTEALRTYVRETVTHRRGVNQILKPTTAPRPSAKVSAIREQHARFLRDLVHVDGGNKPLGECTYEDLMFAAEERRDHARRNLAMADRFEAIANLLQAHDVETVAELPASVLSEAA